MSHCPVSVYLTPEGEFIALFFHDPAKCGGASVINAFEAAATKLYRELKWPEKIRFYIRVEKSVSPPHLVPEPYYCKMAFSVMSSKQVGSVEFLRETSLEEGNRFFSIS